MGIRGRRRETARGAAEEEVENENNTDTDGEGNPKTVPWSLIESDTDDTLTKLCEDFRKDCVYLRYVCAGDLRVWVSDYRKYANKDARCGWLLNDFLECAMAILAEEDTRYCSEPRESLNIPYGEYSRILGSLRYQLCMKLTKYFVPNSNKIRMPYLEDVDW